MHLFFDFSFFPTLYRAGTKLPPSKRGLVEQQHTQDKYLEDRKNGDSLIVFCTKRVTFIMD